MLIQHTEDSVRIFLVSILFRATLIPFYITVIVLQFVYLTRL